MSDLEKEIELYLDGEMTPEQKLIFEERINKDPQLQKDIAVYNEMYTLYNTTDWNITDHKTKNSKVIAYENFLKDEEGKTIIKSIKNAEEIYFQEKQSSNINRKWIFYGISIAAVFIIGLFLLFKPKAPIDSKSLYVEYKNWDNLPSLTLRDKNTAIATAEKLFKQQNYREALAIFRQYQFDESKELNSQVILYIGIAQLELDQNKAAIKTFEQLLYSDTLDAPKANWYLALAYLKIDNIAKTQERLQIITGNHKSDQYQNARNLIEDLDI